MELNEWQLQQRRPTLKRRILSWLNLRTDEAKRTFLMFAFYTVSSVGMLWFEVSTSALFINEYGANALPWIYLASAGIGVGLGVLYSWLQKVLPLRRVIVVIAILMGLPLILFWIGLSPLVLGGYAIFLMRLWVEAIYVLNELNTSITANQLFNIREIKRTYPFISSGILMADVLSGFSLPGLRSLIGLPNLILMASVMMLLGAAILLYISQVYHQFFPDSPRRRLQEKEPDFTARRLRGPLRRYVILTIAFFIMLQVLLLLIDYQYLSQIEQSLNVNLDMDVEDIADFLALFSGILGLFELITQWFVSSRVVEKLGVFVIAMLPPASIMVLSLMSLLVLQRSVLFWLIISLKFVDELLRYTLVASTSPVLFQPIPDGVRSRIQSLARGLAEPISIGVTGLSMLLILKVFNWVGVPTGIGTMQDFLNGAFLILILAASLVWLITVWQLRIRYLELLVLSAERGQLSVSDVDLRAFKRAVADVLNQPGTEADKQSCIELLNHIDPKNVGEVLVPMLPILSPKLQRQSLETMMEHLNPDYLDAIRSLIEEPLPPDVLAVALRYIWLTEPEPDIQQLRPYLNSNTDSVVRGTAAALMLRRGNTLERAEATDTLRRMITHKQEKERVMGCRALGEAVYMQALRPYIRKLLQDESLRVRRALLEAIASTHLEEYYPALIRGLHYKSTREAAMQALVRLENDAIPLLLTVAEDIHKPEIVRTCAWSVLGQVSTMEALDALVGHLMTAWGFTRRSILRVLLKLPSETGIDAVGDRLGRPGIEMLINQELMFMGHAYAGMVDLAPNRLRGREADLLRRALVDVEVDAQDRLFLLMRFLYPSNTIQAAAFNLQSHSPSNRARGLEILDNTLDIPSKRSLLIIFDRRSELEKMQSLTDIFSYTPMMPSDRLRAMMELRHFLSDWALACCFHLAYVEHWRLTPEQALAGLRHPTGYVREAAIAYLRRASPRTFRELFGSIRQDPNPIVSSYAETLMADMAPST